jgi:hypothetical protein
MSDIIKKDPIAPLMPLMTNVMPAPVPQLQYNSGLIQGFLHNIKLGQMEKATLREALITENMDRKLRANLSIIEQSVTFSAKLALTFKKIEMENRQLDIIEKMYQADLEEKQLKNQILYYQVKNEEMDFKLKEKNFQEIYGGKNGTSTP